MIIKNPKNVKTPNPETVKKHTCVCDNCGDIFISLNMYTDRFCTRKCASEYRKNSGWEPSKEARNKTSKALSGRKYTEEQKVKRRRKGNKLTKEWFEENYFGKGLTMKQCAELAGCGMSTISRYMKKYGIQGIRNQYEAQTLGSGNTGNYRDKDWLYQKYIVERMSSTEIAKICVAGRTTIKRWLSRHNINVRDNSEAHCGLKRSKESCAKQSKNFSGEGNPFYGRSHKTESIERMMEKKMYYPYQGGSVKWYKHVRNGGNVLKLQGTWELETARFFDFNNEFYLIHGEFSGFPYKEGNKKRMYFPDFYLPNYNIYLEIKGFFNDTMKEKIERVIEIHNIIVEVWREKDLLDLGILPKRYKYLIAEGYYEDYLLQQ